MSAQQALPLVGGVVGFAIGGPAGAQIGFLAGSILGAVIAQQSIKDHTEIHEQEGLADLSVTSPAYGKMIPIVIGERRIAGNIIWSTDKIEHIQETTESETGPGAKGGGGPTTTTITRTRTYTVSFLLGLCEGPIVSVERVWFDAKLAFDRSQPGDFIIGEPDEQGPSTKGVTAPDSEQKITLYFGSEQQLPSPAAEAVEGVGNVPSYRGLAYLEFSNLDLGTTGRIPNILVEVSTTSLPAGAPFDAHIFTDTTGSGQERLLVGYSGSIFAPRGEAEVVELDQDRMGVITTRRNGDGVQKITTALISTGSLSDVAYLYFGNVADSSVTAIDYGTSEEIYVAATFLAGGESNDGINDLEHVGSGVAVAPSDLSKIKILSSTTGTILHDITTLGPIKRIFFDNRTPPVFWVLGDDATDGRQQAYINTGTLINTFGLSTDVASDIVRNITSDSVYISVKPAGSQGVLRKLPRDGSFTLLDIGLGVSVVPTAITVASDDFVWVVDSAGTQIFRVDPSTDLFQTFSTPVIMDFVCGIGDSGSALAFSNASNLVYAYNSSGTLIDSSPIPSGVFKVLQREDLELCFGLTDSSASVFHVDFDETDISVVVVGGSNSLACAVAQISGRSNINASYIDISGLGTAPVNLAITNNTSAVNIIDTLMQAYQFTMTESEGILKFHEKGGSAWFNVEDEALAASNDDPQDVSIQIERFAANGFPTRITLTYDLADRNYEQGVQALSLTTHKGPDNHLKITLPLALSDQQARNIAEVMLIESHINHSQYNYNLPPAFYQLEPSDIVNITARGISYITRLLETTLTSGLVMENKAIRHRSYIYSDFKGVPGDSLDGDQVIPDIQDSSVILIDGPTLDSADFGLRFHDALYQLSPGVWKGAVLYRSLDNSVTFQTVDSSLFTAKVGVVAGVVQAPVGFPSYGIWDDDTTITVTINAGSLVSSSDLNVFNNKDNQAIIGRVEADNVFRGEFFQYVTATLIGTRTYELTRLLRGRQGTEDQSFRLQTGDFIIFFDSTLLNRLVTYDQARLNTDIPYKVVSSTQGLASAPEITRQLDGRSMRAWAPVVTRDGGERSGTDWILYWRERARLQGELLDSVGITRDPDFQGFEIRIFEDSFFDEARIIRTIDLAPGLFTDPEAEHSYTYTEAQQVTDFGIIQLGVYWDIQMKTSLRTGVRRRAEAGDGLFSNYLWNIDFDYLDTSFSPPLPPAVGAGFPGDFVDDNLTSVNGFFAPQVGFPVTFKPSIETAGFNFSLSRGWKPGSRGPKFSPGAVLNVPPNPWVGVLGGSVGTHGNTALPQRTKIQNKHLSVSDVAFTGAGNPLFNQKGFQTLSISSGSAPSGSDNFTFGIWFSFDIAPVASQNIFVAGAGETEERSAPWQIRYSNANSRVEFSARNSSQISPTPGDQVGADGIVYTPNDWYFALVWHDGVENTINIQINDGTVFTATHLSGVRNITLFRFGFKDLDFAFSNPIEQLRGSIGPMIMYDRLLDDWERTLLYNNRLGNHPATGFSGDFDGEFFFLPRRRRDHGYSD